MRQSSLPVALLCKYDGHKESRKRQLCLSQGFTFNPNPLNAYCINVFSSFCLIFLHSFPGCVRPHLDLLWSLTHAWLHVSGCLRFDFLHPPPSHLHVWTAQQDYLYPLGMDCKASDLYWLWGWVRMFMCVLARTVYILCTASCLSLQLGNYASLNVCWILQHSVYYFA